MSPKTAVKWAKGVLAGLGLLIFLYLVHRIGPAVLAANLKRFGPWFLAILALACCWIFIQALAWWLIQKAYFQRLPLGILYRIRIISDGFNLILPSANLGGDAMRVFMIKGDVPLRDGIPSVLFDKTIEFIGSLVFLFGGILLGLATLRLPATLVVPVSISLCVTAVVVVVFVVIQKRGLTYSLTKLGRLLPKLRGWAEKHGTQLEAMDRNFRLLYTRSNKRAIPPLLLHVLARLVGASELMIIMAVLKSPVNYVQALFISTVLTAGNTAFFVLPGQWGVTEGLSILVLQSLGFPAAIGLSVSVIRRVRRLIMAGLALILFAAEKKKPPRKEGS